MKKEHVPNPSTNLSYDDLSFAMRVDDGGPGFCFNDGPAGSVHLSCESSLPLEPPTMTRYASKGCAGNGVEDLSVRACQSTAGRNAPYSAPATYPSGSCAVQLYSFEESCECTVGGRTNPSDPTNPAQCAGYGMLAAEDRYGNDGIEQAWSLEPVGAAPVVNAARSGPGDALFSIIAPAGRTQLSGGTARECDVSPPRGYSGEACVFAALPFAARRLLAALLWQGSCFWEIVSSFTPPFAHPSSGASHDLSLQPRVLTPDSCAFLESSPPRLLQVHHAQLSECAHPIRPLRGRSVPAQSPCNCASRRDHWPMGASHSRG